MSLSLLGDIATAEDVARAAVFLASGQSSAITGIGLNATNGMVTH